MKKEYNIHHQKNSVLFLELEFLPRKSREHISNEDKNHFIELALKYTRAKLQRVLKKETIMSKMRTLPYYLYKSGICRTR